MSINSKDGCGVVPMGIKYASQWLRVDGFVTPVSDTMATFPELINLARRSHTIWFRRNVLHGTKWKKLMLLFRENVLCGAKQTL